MRMLSINFCLSFMMLFMGVVSSCSTAQSEEKTTSQSTKAAKKPVWKNLLDGKSLKGWKKTQFGGEGEIMVKKGEVTMATGVPLTGITSTDKKIPLVNYEIELEAKKVLGGDFFCCVTFPVKKSHCSFVAGGWGGAVIGISSLDGQDASQNETTDYVTFEKGKWYKFRVRVRDNDIQVWLDDKPVVQLETKGKKLSTRIEVALSQPLGVCAFETSSTLRNIRIRTLSQKEIAAKIVKIKKSNLKK